MSSHFDIVGKFKGKFTSDEAVAEAIRKASGHSNRSFSSASGDEEPAMTHDHVLLALQMSIKMASATASSEVNLPLNLPTMSKWEDMSVLRMSAMKSFWNSFRSAASKFPRKSHSFCRSRRSELEAWWFSMGLFPL